VLGEVSTGAYSDLKQANGIARSMITKYGMSDTLGNLVFANESDEVFIGRDFVQTKNYSEEIAAQIDREVKKIIDSCYERIKNILKENINKLHAVANALWKRKNLKVTSLKSCMQMHDLFFEKNSFLKRDGDKLSLFLLYYHICICYNKQVF